IDPPPCSQKVIPNDSPPPQIMPCTMTPLNTAAMDQTTCDDDRNLQSWCNVNRSSPMDYYYLANS
ncbi:MAG: hypothetical protein ACPG32_14635, partial [Akkermansiaceae bacterium]